MDRKFFIVIIIMLFIIGIGIDVEASIEIKKYKVINSEKVCGDKLCTEFEEERAKMGLSSRDIKICGMQPCKEVSGYKEKTNLSNPMGQFELGIPIDLIKCQDGFSLVIKASNLHPACVKIENVEKIQKRNWALNDLKMKEIFDDLKQKRKIKSSEVVQNLETTMNIKSEIINNQRYLMFDGSGWHRLHNVEITISNDTFFESVRTKTDDRGHLNMPWPIPDSMGGVYNIFATDGIHKFEIDIPISFKK